MSTPDLTGRVARCYCGRGEPSPNRERLAFFEYRGPGSVYEQSCIRCGRAEFAHPVYSLCSSYQPRVGGFHEDAYYCGHRGWD